MYFYDKKTNEKYYTKQDLLWSKLDFRNIASYFGEGFDSIDWAKEPVESLKELRKQRAQQLRDTYSYLVLYYGGGSDSSTVLNSFLDNNIKLDEVVISRFIDIDMPLLNGKLPLYKLLLKNYSGKITTLDFTYDSLTKYYNNQLWSQYRNTGYGKISVLLRTNLNQLAEMGIIKSIHRPSDTAHITGQSCPLIKVIDNKYYSELSCSTIGGASFNIFSEPFFSTPKFPKLLCKESHILVNYWKEHFPTSNRIVESDHASTGIFKNLIRDEWELKFSPLKGENKISNFFNPNTENGAAFIAYSKKDDKKLLNLWKDSTLKEFKKVGLGLLSFTNNKSSLNKRFFISER